MKKMILVIFSLMILFSGCCKEEVEIASVNYKVGIVQDINLHRRTLALEFQSSFGALEKVNFESLWTFEVDRTPIYLELNESDFAWQYQGRTIKGICKTSLGELLATPNVIHKRTTLKGYAKVDGKWVKI